MKKQFVLICVFAAMLLSIVPAGAVSDKAIFEVRSLGIVRGDENGNLRLGDDVTRGEFTTIVVRMLGYDDLIEGRTTVFSDVPVTHIHSGAIALICDLGYINGDGNGNFNPDEPILVQDCLKILVHSVGYEIAAQGRGGYPGGYISVANQLELTKDLDRTVQQNATRGDVVSMVYYALQADLLEQGYSYNGEYIKSGENLKDRLSYKGDIAHTSDIVTANYDTWLMRPLADIEKDEIEIDSVRYTSGNIDTSALIGRRVEVYYREEASGRRTILNIALSNKNEETVVDDESFEALRDKQLSYRDENDRKAALSFDPNAVYVYNNRVLTSYVPEDLLITQGRYECIDNDADNLCEYVFIYEYESSVVDRVNPNGCIYLKNELLISGRNYVVLDENDRNFDYKLSDAEGNELTITDVRKDNIVTVYKSKDGTFTQIVVSDKTVNGKIEEIADDGIILISGESYGRCDNINSAGLILGNNVTAYINDLGEVVYVEEAAGDTRRYGYVIASGKEGLSKYMVKILVAGDLKNASEVDETSEDDDVIPVLYCKNSEIIIAELESRVKFNGSKVSAENVVTGLDSYIPVKFKINDEGKLSYIEQLMPLEYGSVSVKMKYNAKDRIFGGIAAAEPFGVDDETKIICIPANAGASEEDMLTMIKIDNRDADVSYMASGYERDEDTKCVKLLVIIEEMHAAVAQNITTHSDMGIVQGSYVKNENGEELHILNVLKGEEEIQLVTKSVSGDNGDTDRLKKGDFIIYKLNNDGYLVNSRIIKSLGSALTHNVSNSGSPNKNGAVTGTVVGINRLEIRNDADNLARIHTIDIQAGSSIHTVELSVRNLPDFYIYDKETQEAEKASFDDIMHGDTVCISMPETETYRDLVIVRGE